ncbi:nuclear speckle RNA-binding protein A [Brachypodium distachyon]|uniref:RRM domain-containing protein n=1 Tax=Brachypodium distachyon TaxID=15368 RepID=I1H150_BRADI|nr:nuclear speckle RNA-binding protein A [Brachypodium distachyon]KQK19651.1 hypothetical protein BRADI_1g49600v3 [Brachypodium distachyon]|eukprot:XP_003557104.1 nuclear speckle RNA-binding protein A [Brachypodium distachyon]
MADAYWRYNADPRQLQQQQQQQMLPPSARAPNAAAPAAAGQQPLKRPRPAEYSDVPGSSEMAGYYPRDEERAGYAAAAAAAAARDTQALNASYERYLRTGQIQSHGAGPAGGSIRPAAGANAGYQLDDRVAIGGVEGRNVGFGTGMPEPPLPPDASNTLFIEGIPNDCERREVSHIFRPFVGFKEVRLVTKEPRHPGGDPIVLCFVDFTNAAQAAVAMEALQGYKFDEHDRTSPHLRLQFARFTGPRGQSGPGGGGGRIRR